MAYSTIGITGIDLLFLNNSLRGEFISRISGMLDSDVENIIYDLEFNANTINKMFQEGTLIRDPDTPEYSQLLNDVETFKKYYTTFQEKKSEEMTFEDLFTDETNEFESSDDSDDLLGSLVKDIETSDVEKIDYLKESNSEILYKEIESLPEHIKQGIDLYAAQNMFDSLISDYSKLPVKFRDADIYKADSSVDTFTRNIVCLIAQRAYLIEDILSDIFRYKNRLSNPIGIPLTYRYDRPFSLQGAFDTYNKCMRSSNKITQQKAIVTVDQMLHSTSKILDFDNSLVSYLENDMYSYFGENSSRVKAVFSNKSLKLSVQYFYKFFYYSRKFKIENIFGNEYNLLHYDSEVSAKLVESYNLYGFLPKQLDVFLRNISNLPKITSSVNDRELKMDEILNIRIIRNALLGMREFKSRR